MIKTVIDSHLGAKMGIVDWRRITSETDGWYDTLEEVPCMVHLRNRRMPEGHVTRKAV